MNGSFRILSAAAALVAAAAACSTPPPARGQESSARALGVFSTRLPERADEQTALVLAQDARRREQRFLEAALPGRSFAATRAEAVELEEGRFPADEIFQIGAQLFHLTFTRDVGFGGSDLPARARFHRGARGGPDAIHCAQCHWRGGPAGAGDGADAAFLGGDGDSQASAFARNPIALTGDGWIEILAREMSEELAQARGALVGRARNEGAVVSGALTSKGISFGTLTARPDGSLDTRLVEGVDGDLVVRPFGYKGTFATLRDAVEDALNVHHGMQSSHLAKTASEGRVGTGPRPDPDGDGHADEINEGQVSALTAFVAMQEVPQVALPSVFDVPGTTRDDVIELARVGRARFEAIGCASCHVPQLAARSSIFRLPSRQSGAEITIDLAEEGAEPRLPKGAPAPLFSDLKRHDMGAPLAENRPDRGVDGRYFLTRPLWGVARSRPYLHDGRAPTLEDAIVLHGGEAQASRDAFVRLEEIERASIRVFLTTLTRARRIVAQ